MSSYIDQEAEESDNDYSDSEQPKKKKLRVTNEDEDDEDDDDDDAEEINDLINDEEEEGEEEENEKEKSDQESEEEDLDEEDLNLLEENLGVKINRQKRKFKRVRRLDSSDEEDKDERAAIAEELFEDDEDRPQRTDSRRDLEDREIGEGSEESDDEDNFIVDDHDRPISRPRKKRSYRYNDEALQQAQDVFGLDFDYSEFDNYGETYEDDEDEDEDEEEGDEARARRKSKAKKTQRKSIFEIYEPAELEKSFLNERDKEMTSTDLPERFQLRAVPVTTADEQEIKEESEWIYNQIFNQLTISNQTQNSTNNLGGGERQPIGGKKPPSVKPKIHATLNFIRNHKREVPFIAFYRKEYVEGLTIDDLWLIYKYDEKWCQLQQRKQNLKKLIEDMQKYQMDIIMAKPDDPLPDSTRIITDSDLALIEACSNFEELRDVQVQFQLYYGPDFPKMKQAKIRAEKEKRTEARLQNGENSDTVLIEEEEMMTQRLDSLKLIQRKDPYTICKEAGIHGVAIRFGLTPEQFGENLRDSYQKHEVEQIPIEPEEFAQDYVCPKFSKPSDVLDAAKYVMARQLSSNPIVRKVVRGVFFDKALVHCRPTKKGMKEIDENHPCYPFKYLRNKPVKNFVGADFIHLVVAEREGLIEMEITFDLKIFQGGEFKPPPSTYLDEIKLLYQRDEFSANVQKWNKLRLDALTLGIYKFLLHDLRTEITTKLVKEAHEAITRLACRRLYDWLKIGPYKVDPAIAEDEDFDVREGIRILGFALAHHSEGASFAALVDGDGEYTDHLKLPYYMLKRGESASEKEKELRERDRDHLKKFIFDKKPHVICIGAKSLIARDVIQDLQTMISELCETEQFPQIPIELMDDELSLVYMNSKRALTDFPDFPPILRQAISLARRLQDPLIEFSQLCTSDDEILCIKYQGLQDHVPKDDLLFNLQLEFINRVNEVGVDINRCIVHPHTSQLLQFVCGLGPRKAAALLRNLKKLSTPLLETRTQLLVNCEIGDQVFQNCAGFIKIDTAQLSESGTDTYIEVLDSTRIHPEAYDLARKMAIDALEYDDNNEAPTSNAIEDIMENPENLKDLDLDAFAAQLEKEGCGPKKITLYDIREELNHPYKDLREQYPLPTSEQIFQLLTKETPETFYRGKLVLGTVLGISRKKPAPGQLDENNPIKVEETGMWQCPVCRKNDFLELNEVWNHYDAEMCPGEAVGVRVKLDNGLIGLVPLEFVSSTPVIDPSERVKPGMTIHARILEINVEKFHVRLTCRSTDLNDTTYNYAPNKDERYDFDLEDRDNTEEEEKRKRKANKQVYVKRIIVHPSFHNIDYEQSEKLMAMKPPGEAIFRPSSKGTDHLTLTWKVCEGVLQHFDILEQNKDNDFSLGHQLIIKLSNNREETFEDLDEIIARFVTPMVRLASDIRKFKRFQLEVYGSKEVAERILKEEAVKNPKYAKYIVSFCKDYPGKLLLSYVLKEKCYHEYISITPYGLKYRDQMFPRHSGVTGIDDLIEWFKKNFKNVRPRMPMGTPNMGQFAAQTTPRASPAISMAGGVPGMAGMPGMPPPNRMPAGMSWSRQAAGWQQQRPLPARTPSYATPGASSQMSISPRPVGDQTPLLDEY